MTMPSDDSEVSRRPPLRPIHLDSNVPPELYDSLPQRSTPAGYRPVAVDLLEPWLSAEGAYAPVMATRFGMAFSLLGSRNSRMPFLKLAFT
jgi:hypothetical protein